MSVLETLEAARRKISDPSKWAKGVAAKDADGCALTIRQVSGPSAVCWCATGAVCAVTDSFFDQRETLELLDGLTGIAEGDYGSLRPIAAFNDNRSHAELMDLFDKAIYAASHPSPTQEGTRES